MEIILDTNFIISCIRKRIDFISLLEAEGFRIAVPRGVLQELKDLRRADGTTHGDRVAIDIAFQMLNDKKIKRIRVGGKTIDEGLIAKGREGIFIATLDRAIKREVQNKVFIDNSGKGIKVEKGE